MLRSSSKKQIDQGSPFKEEGYLARIVQIVDCGQQPQTDWITKEAKEPRYEVQFTFEFPHVLNDEDKPKWLSKTYQFPMAWPEKEGIKDNSNLFKLFNTFTPEVLKQSKYFKEYWYFDDSVWERLLGMEVYLDVGKTSTGNPKIKSVSRIPSLVKEPVPPLVGTPLLFDLGSATVEEWDQLYDWVQRKIAGALDEDTSTKAMKFLGPDGANQDKKTEEGPASVGRKMKDSDMPAEDPGAFEDDIPF